MWVRNSESINFHETWLDDKAGVLRLPGVVACSSNRETLQKLIDLAKEWHPLRYHEGQCL